MLVDFGRSHSRGLGVPIGGAADRTSLTIGNALVGNPPDALALEITLAGPTIRAECDLACVVYGASFDLSSSRQSLKTGTTFTMQTGETVTVGGAYAGVRAYFCVAGGFDNPTVLGSRSAWQPLSGESVLACSSSRISRRFVKIPWNWDESTNSGPTMLRILNGAQSDWFPADILCRDGMDSASFRISPSGNRMGLRLDGQTLPYPDREMVSEPVCPGTMQVTRSGQPILLGIDGQTIGGYPKLAQVISADVDKLGQLRPGDDIVFRKVPLEEAERLWLDKQAELVYWVKQIRMGS